MQAEQYATVCEHRKRHATLQEMIINCAAMYMVPHLMAPAPPSAPRGIICALACTRARLYGCGKAIHQFRYVRRTVHMLAQYTFAQMSLYA